MRVPQTGKQAINKKLISAHGKTCFKDFYDDDILTKNNDFLTGFSLFSIKTVLNL